MDSTLISKIRIVIMAFIVFFLYAVIFIQLWTIQVQSGDEILEKVSEQYVRKIRIPAVRGRESGFRSPPREPVPVFR